MGSLQFRFGQDRVHQRLNATAASYTRYDADDICQGRQEAGQRPCRRIHCLRRSRRPDNCIISSRPELTHGVDSSVFVQFHLVHLTVLCGPFPSRRMIYRPWLAENPNKNRTKSAHVQSFPKNAAGAGVAQENMGRIKRRVAGLSMSPRLFVCWSVQTLNGCDTMLDEAVTINSGVQRAIRQRVSRTC